MICLSDTVIPREEAGPHPMTATRLEGAYGQFVRTARIWAALNVGIALTLILPMAFYDVALGVKMGLGLRPPVDFPIFIFGALYVWVILRATRRGLEAGRSPQGYPERHWRVVSAGMRSASRLNVFLGTIGLVFWCCSIIGDGPFAEKAAVGAVVVDAIALYLMLVNTLALVDWLRHAFVVPYFGSRVGEIETYTHGGAIARRVGELDELAGALGVRPLSVFGWNDDFAGEPLVWHESAEGLVTVEALLDHLRAEGADEAPIIDDLERIAHALARAAEKEIRFCLLLRHGTTTSGHEWDVLLSRGRLNKEGQEGQEEEEN